MSIFIIWTTLPFWAINSSSAKFSGSIMARGASPTETDRNYGRAWQVAWAILFSALALTIVLVTAQQAHVIVLDVNKVDVDVMMLAAATVVLTAVAVGVGIAAIWGYAHLERATVATALAQSKKIAERVAAARADEIVPRLIEARFPGATPLDAESDASAFSRNGNREEG
jgi:succinate dehydrogenase hydrophobic anchor subunit